MSSGDQVVFSELVNMLPNGDLVAVRCPQAGVSVPTEAKPDFIEPPLRVIRAVELGQTSVILLSAPAAVGKTTLAEAIAVRKAAILWQLAEITVGAATFSGTLQNLYDSDANTVFNHLMRGEHLLVLDALDETKSRAGSAAFDSFIADIITRLKTPRARPCAILLGRTETAEWVEAMFEAEHVPYAHYRIEFFDESGAREFIARRLDGYRRKDNLKSVHRTKPFEDVRENVFGLVYKLLAADAVGPWNSDSVRSFLGYAPVLEVLTDFLDESRNPADLGKEIQKLRQEFENAVLTGEGKWRFLMTIINKLTTREHDKVIGRLSERCATLAAGLGWSSWSDLYNADEQYARVLQRAVGPAAGPLIPILKLPAKLAGEYDVTMKEHDGEHVMVGGRAGFASLVFQEFIYAWALSRANEAVRVAVRSHMRKHRFVPSPLIGRFMLHFGAAGEELDGQDLGILYDSFLSRVSDGLETRMLVGGNDTDGVCVLSTQQKGQYTGLQETAIQLSLLDGIRFWRHIQNAVIGVDCSVHLGHEGDECVIGPDIDVVCKTLHHDASGYGVHTGGEGIRLQAEHFEGWDPSKKEFRIFDGERRIEVYGPAASPPWQQFYRGRPSVPPTGDPVRLDALLRFLRMFRKQKGRLIETVQHAGLTEEQRRGVRDALIKLCLEEGIIERDGPFFIFNNDFDSLKVLVGGPQRAHSPAALAFLKKWL